MSQTPAQTADGPLKIVLFGLPRAGKTGLLAALAQAQQLDDPSGGLTRQQALHYDEQARSTDEETVSYPIRFPTPQGPVDVELVDCAGRLVLDMLKNREPVEKVSGKLPREILDADALIVVVDVSLKPESLERVLTALDDFLRRHEQSRSRHSEVTGLPVFLVLSKVDLLAVEKDSLSDWMGRVEEQKRNARRQLGDFLDEPGQERPAAFGRLDVHLWATALKRPALGNNPARPRDPYNVAELFRSAVTAAQAYRQREERSGRRLRWAVGGVGGMAAALLALGGLMLGGLLDRSENDLRRRVERYQAFEGGTIADRLHDWPDDLRDRRKELKEIRTDPDFDDLPEKLRDFVEDRLAELNEYIPYLEKVLSPRFATLARNEADLQKREQTLLRELKPPHTGWEETGAARLRQRRLDDLQLLRDRAGRTVAWYQQLYSEGNDLAQFRRPPPQGGLINWRQWQDEAELFLARVNLPPAPTLDLPNNSPVTPFAILRFDKVRIAREDVLGSEGPVAGKPGVVAALLAMRDVASALGLTAPTRQRPDLLAIPRPPDFNAADAVARWRRLESHPALVTSLAGLAAGSGPIGAAAAFPPEHPLIPPYPNFERDFSLQRVPEPAQQSVALTAEGSYRYLLSPLQEVVRRKYESVRGEAEETPAHWRAVGEWLRGNPADVRAFRRLAEVLDRLRRTQPAEPVADLAGFLLRSEHTFEARSATLTLPFRLEVSPPDSGVLVVRAGPREYRFRLKPEETRPDGQSRSTTYHFSTGDTRLVFRPGEECTATLELRNDRVLTWAGGRTRTFAFECLSRPPRLHRKGDTPSQGLVASGAVLKIEPTMPGVPDLLPDVRASSREP